MARHRLDDSDKQNKWGGPELAERKDSQPQRHRRDRDNSQSRDAEAERNQPPQR